jgi:hypothetical protein
MSMKMEDVETLKEMLIGADITGVEGITDGYGVCDLLLHFRLNPHRNKDYLSGNWTLTVSGPSVEDLLLDHPDCDTTAIPELPEFKEPALEWACFYDRT